MPKRWSVEDCFRLFCVILAVQEIKVHTGNWTTIAEKMGDGFTTAACRQKFHGIMKAVAEPNSAVNDTPPATPLKSRKRKATDEDGIPAKRGRKARGLKMAQISSGDEGREEEV